MVALKTSALKVNYCPCCNCERMLAELGTLQEVNYINKDAEPHMVIISIIGDPYRVRKVLKKYNKMVFEHIEQSPPKNNQEMSIVIPQAPVPGIYDQHMVPQLSGYKSTGITLKALDVVDNSTVDKTQLCCPECSRELKLKSSIKPFACNGCKEDGIGSRYRCEFCDYDLHKECMSPKRTISPEFFQGSTFEFCRQPSSTRASKSCYACGNDIHGFFYHCEWKHLNLHPCCSNLEVKLCGMDFVHRDKMDSSSSKCTRCKKKMSSRNPGGCSYVSTSKKCHFHVNCITQMAHEAWKKGPIDESNDISMALGKMDLMLTEDKSSRGSDGAGIIEILKTVSTFLGAIVGILFGAPVGMVVPMLFDLFFLAFPKLLKK